MADDIPQWAIDRADSLIAEYPWSVPWRTSGIGGNRIALAFATYIAAHEEPPLDPLLIEAREICAAEAERDCSEDAAQAYRKGRWDDAGHMRRVLVALKRGIELAGKR